MMSDEYLADVLCRELKETGDVIEAVRAVRLSIEAYREERRHQRRAPAAVAGARTLLGTDQLDAIFVFVATELGMTSDAIRTGSGRTALHARWVVAGVLRRFYLTLSEIARVLGMPSHVRVLDGLRRLEGFPGLVATRELVLARLEAKGWTPAPRSTPPSEEA